MKLTCGICFGVFEDVSEYKRHFKRHKERTLGCHLCELKFFKISTLARHLAVVHLMRDKFKFKSIKDKINVIQSNEITINDEIELDQPKKKSHNCLICNKEFKQLSSLKSHESCMHSTEEAFQCEICAKTFKVRSNLLQHKRFHTKEKNHACNLCSATFFTTSHLKSHLKIHNNERNYQCNVPDCGKTFIHSSSFKKHMNSHNNVKNYSCKICNKSFSQSCHLKEHERTHSDERRFKCPEIDCGKSFKRLDTLVTHQKMHTR